MLSGGRFLVLGSRGYFQVLSSRHVRVTILPHPCHDPASVVSRSCLSCVTILPHTCHFYTNIMPPVERSASQQVAGHPRYGDSSPTQRLFQNVVHKLIEVGVAGAESVAVMDGTIGVDDNKPWYTGDAPVLHQFVHLILCR